jgi:adenylylsulfate kinase-like enzyme
MKSFVCLITGPAGAGKSTIADILASRLPKTARIDVDYVRHMIKSGKVKPHPYTSEANVQIALAARNVCTLAKNFVSEGYSVFIDDVVVREEHMDNYRNLLKDIPFFVFLLLPNADVLTRRDLKRGPEVSMGVRAAQLHEEFSAVKGKMQWTVIDNSDQTSEETASILSAYISKKV